MCGRWKGGIVSLFLLFAFFLAELFALSSSGGCCGGLVAAVVAVFWRGLDIFMEIGGRD
jgi:hypothetical protein